MKKHLSGLTQGIKPADIFIFFVFTVFQFTMYWWYRKLFFIMAFSLLLIYYIIYAAVFRIDIKPILHSFDALDLTALLFGSSLVLTALFSEYRDFSVGLLQYQEGLIIYLFYIAAFIVLRRAVCFERRHLYIFITAGFVVSLLAITVFFGIVPVSNPSTVLTTYTNIDMLSQILIMYIAVNFILSLRQTDRIIRVLHFAAELLFMLTAIIAQCDGIIVFLAVLFVILPFASKIDLTAIRRLVLSVSAFSFALSLFNIFGKYAKKYDTSLLIELAQGVPFYITLLIGAALLAAAFMIKSSKKYDLTKICRWAFPSLIVLGIAAAFIFFGKPLLSYYNLYGGKRTDLIKVTFSAYTRFFSPIQRLFGTGMSSFRTFIKTQCPQLIPENLHEALLYQHNFILELIFETGAVGFITCGAFLTSAFKNAVKQKDECRRIALTAVVLYLVTRLFYIPSPEITPIALLFLAGCCPAVKCDRPKTHLSV